MEQWLIGNSCPLPQNLTTNTTCTAGGLPAYIVNATTVKQIQLAINFARSRNLRLIIKNSGHDFSGRSSGGESLSVWTHHLKDLEYIPSVEIGEYKGRAVRIGAGVQTYDIFSFMRTHNVTLIAAGGVTVGVLGGYMQGGGHSTLTSYYGMMSDQILSLEVVTADGRFVHADMNENEDLYFAIRGGGGSTFGIVTSAIIKAYPSIEISTASIGFSTPQISNKTFWNGIRIYMSHVNRLCDAKGIGFNYIRTTEPTANMSRTFSFTVSFTLPGMSHVQAAEFMAPLISDLKQAGVNVSSPSLTTYPNSGAIDIPRGDVIQTRHLASRLFPRDNFDPNGSLFNATVQVIKDFVVLGGYLFHSINHCPTNETAGYPGVDSALNPAYRKTVCHASGYDMQSYDVPPAQQIAYHKRLNDYIQPWRDITPGSGSYMNEADVEEPDFQSSFYGAHYPRLLHIKRKRDPWRLFYAVTGVGSEDWKMRGTEGLPTQNGRLCRVEDSPL